jgi:hypothetical protein
VLVKALQAAEAGVFVEEFWHGGGRNGQLRKYARSAHILQAATAPGTVTPTAEVLRSDPQKKNRGLTRKEFS